MRLIRCRKCGAVVTGEDDFVQEIHDALERQTRIVITGRTRREREAAQERAANLRAVYKAYMHNLTTLQYAQEIAPSVLQAVKVYCYKHKRMTQDEWDAAVAQGKADARMRQIRAKQEMELCYGSARSVIDSARRDPTFNAAAQKINRDSRRNSRNGADK